VVAIMSGVLQGLHAAHEARNERGEPLGIVHRDVSPQNILVGSDGQARVLDFGVAKAAGRMQTTRDGQLKGKLSYMAPEQLGGKTLDRRSDVYSASVVLWETLTGERLFAAENEGATIARVLEGNAPPPSRVLAKQGRLPKGLTPAALGKLDKVVAKGLALEPEDRFGTAREMALALEECIQPATASQVSQWIERIASSVLALRAEQVAEIESSSSAGIMASDVAAEIAQKSSPTASDDVPTVSIASNPSNPQPEPPSQVSSVSALSSPSTAVTTGESKRSRGWLVVVAVLVLVVAGAWVFRPTPKTDAATRPAGTGASGPPSAPAETASAPVAASASAEPAPSASLSPPASASAPPTAKPPAIKPPAVRPPPYKPPATQPHKACDPPYTWDAQGRKHYKPECL
jgi:serine/threonine-protein kinase